MKGVAILVGLVFSVAVAAQPVVPAGATAHPAPGGGQWYSWGKFGSWMYNINGTTVGPLDMPPLGWGGGGPFFFDDGSHWALSSLVKTKEGQDDSQVIIDGARPVPGWNVAKVADTQGEAFTWFSGGSTTDLLYWRSGSQGATPRPLYTLSQGASGWTLTSADQKLGPFASFTRPLVSPDGAHWAVVAQLVQGGFAAISDGRVGVSAPKGVAAENLSADFEGGHLTYHVRLHDNDLQAYQVTDNDVLGPYARAGTPVFSRNGQHQMAIVEVAKAGSKTLFFDGKPFGPFLGMRDGDRHYFDLEHGHFVFQNKDKTGVQAVTDQGTFGPFAEVYPLASGPRQGNDYTGLLWGFVGKTKNGKGELHVFSGFPGGGKTYPNVQLPSEGDQQVTPDGQDWFYPLANGQQLHNGELVN